MRGIALAILFVGVAIYNGLIDSSDRQLSATELKTANAVAGTLLIASVICIFLGI
jgi:hypothetical protein